MEKRRLHRLAAILREATPGPEHNRLQDELGEWAHRAGYVRDLHTSLPKGGRPDVFRYIEEQRFLFIGDAKDSSNETSFSYKTYMRISGYLEDFADFVAEGDIAGGRFTIATDNWEDAKAWANRLNLLAADLGLSDGAGAPPSFQVDQIGEPTWVAWW